MFRYSIGTSIERKLSSRQKSGFDAVSILVSNTVPLTRLLILIHVQRTYHNCTYNRLPEDELLGSKHVEDVKIKTGNINLGTVHLGGTCCLITSISQYTVQKHKKGPCLCYWAFSVSDIVHVFLPVFILPICISSVLPPLFTCNNTCMHKGGSVENRKSCIKNRV